jgi:hypothetical protein
VPPFNCACLTEDDNAEECSSPGNDGKSTNTSPMEVIMSSLKSGTERHKIEEEKNKKNYWFILSLVNEHTDPSKPIVNHAHKKMTKKRRLSNRERAPKISTLEVATTPTKLACFV